jgi:hypothetical protein
MREFCFNVIVRKCSSVSAQVHGGELLNQCTKCHRFEIAMPQAIRTSRKALVLRISQFPDLPEAPHPRREVRMRDNSKMTRTMCGNSVAAHYLGSNDPDLNAPFFSEPVRRQDFPGDIFIQ